MKDHSGTIGIKAAICTIDDRDAFLRRVRDVACARETHIICFNADMLAGKVHALAAIRHAVRSFDSGTPIANSLEMETLLYAAGSRQTSIGMSFGIHTGENHLYICCCPAREEAFGEIGMFVAFCDEEDPWEQIDLEKRARLMKLFGVTECEIGTTLDHNIRPLVLERVALLDVYR